MGDVSALSLPCVAVVGTRHPSGYGADMAKTIASGAWPRRVCAWSAAWRSASTPARTQARCDAAARPSRCSAAGCDVPYPPENIGAVSRDPAVRRRGDQRIPAGFAAAHLPLSRTATASSAGCAAGSSLWKGAIKSGGMITVRTALDQGREVFAVPGNIGQYYAEGPNAIIREGAVMISSASGYSGGSGHRECAPDCAGTEAAGG